MSPPSPSLTVVSVGKTNKLDDYLTNIRSVEQQMQRDDHWLDTPRYKVEEKLPKPCWPHGDMISISCWRLCISRWCDTTRVVTFVPMEEGGLYHGTALNKSPEKSLPEMDKWDRKWIGGLAKLGGKLKAFEEGEGSFSTGLPLCMAAVRRRPHYSHDLPLLLLGGKDYGFRHGQYLAFQPLEEPTPNKVKRPRLKTNGTDFTQTPLSNLYVSLPTRWVCPPIPLSTAMARSPIDGMRVFVFCISNFPRLGFR